MADNTRVFAPGFRITDSSGNPAAGATIEFYEAGTSNARTVYSDNDLTVALGTIVHCDSAGSPVSSQGSSSKVLIFTGTGDYKVVIKDSTGVTLQTFDNITGALDTSGFDDDIAIPSTPVLYKAVNYTVAVADRGKIIAGDATGGDISITLLSAITAGDGFRITVKNVGTSGAVSVAPPGGQTIDGSTADFDLDNANEAITLTSDAANWNITDDALISTDVTTPLPRSYLSGLQLSNNASDSDHDIDIAAGVARDSANSFNFSLAATLVKRIDASWAAGTAAGGMATGVSLDVDTLYHVFLVDDGSDGTDAGFDTDIDATNLLATTGVGTKYRRLGSVLTDGTANILAFSQDGDEFLWSVVTQDLNATATTSTALATLSVPTGLKVRADIQFAMQGSTDSTGGVYIASPDAADTAAHLTAAPGVTHAHTPGAGGTPNGASSLMVRTDTSGRVRYSATASLNLKIWTRGWIDRRGKDD